MSASKARARTDIQSIEAELVEELRLIREALAAEDGSRLDEAIAAVETFAAVALRVMAKTNPSKVRSEAMNVEIQARMDGVPVVRGLL